MKYLIIFSKPDPTIDHTNHAPNTSSIFKSSIFFTQPFQMPMVFFSILSIFEIAFLP